MKQLPALWLLIIIIGLPQLSETIYSPALPDIVHALKVAESLVEMTLTIFLLGFALGTLLWGNVSDRYGRKPCLILGMILYTVGCIGCALSQSITFLLISRFLQAVGGSTGSVIGQAICRDIFHGAQLSSAYAIIAGTLAFSPAIGPVLGGILDQYFGWKMIFVTLMFLGTLVTFLIKQFLAETLLTKTDIRIPLLPLAKTLLQDPLVILCGILVAGCNGIQFSYYAEAPFYFIEILNLSPSMYGCSFAIIACATILGSVISKKASSTKHYLTIIRHGLSILTLGALLWSTTLILHSFFTFSTSIVIGITICCMIFIMIGSGIIIPQALSAALKNYTHARGTAASLFGFFYYFIITLITLVMSLLHNKTLIPMPVYFLSIGIAMCIWYWHYKKTVSYILSNNTTIT